MKAVYVGEKGDQRASLANVTASFCLHSRSTPGWNAGALNF